MRRIIVGTVLLSIGALVGPALAQGKITAVGVVVDQDGNPVPDVEVTLEYKGHVYEKYFTKTDKNGKFLHVNVYQGPYIIHLKKEGHGEGQVEMGLREIGLLEKPPQFSMPKKAAGPAPEAERELTPEEQRQAAHKAVNDRMNVAVELAEAGSLDEAQAAYQEILELAPTYADAHYNLGHLQKRRGDLAGAEASFRKAIELDVKFAEAHNALAALLLEGGKVDAAHQALVQAAEIVPDNAQVQFNLGIMSQNVGKYPEAKTAFLRAAELDPENAEVNFYLGTIALGANDTAEALSRLEKYLSLNPQNPQNVEAAKGILAYLKK
jgi:tetratricopeptide (TPR) repeat protein